MFRIKQVGKSFFPQVKLWLLWSYFDDYDYDGGSYHRSFSSLEKAREFLDKKLADKQDGQRVVYHPYP